MFSGQHDVRVANFIRTLRSLEEDASIREIAVLGMVCQAPSATPFLFKTLRSGKVPEDVMLYVLWRSASPRAVI